MEHVNQFPLTPPRMGRGAAMKQTKPYGRAYDPPSSNKTTAPPRQFVEEKRASPSVKADDDASDAARPAYTPAAAKPPRKKSRTRRLLIQLAVSVAMLIAYVALRDSVFVQNVIQLVSNKETVMTCMEGEMRYEGWSLWDRLWGNGRFICTDWKVQNRFVSLPRF